MALTGASGKSALDVEQQIDELLTQAQSIANRAKGLSVPGEMASAQRNLLLTLDLRVEGMTKLAALVPRRSAGQAKQASTKIAGDMEIFLASDVIYSQRVAPLIQQTLADAGITGLSTAPSRFLPNIGWLEPATVARTHHRDSPLRQQLADGARAGHTRQRADRRERGHQHARSRNRRSTTSAAAAARRSR